MYCGIFLFSSLRRSTLRAHNNRAGRQHFHARCINNTSYHCSHRSSTTFGYLTVTLLCGVAVWYILHYAVHCKLVKDFRIFLFLCMPPIFWNTIKLISYSHIRARTILLSEHSPESCLKNDTLSSGFGAVENKGKRAINL